MSRFEAKHDLHGKPFLLDTATGNEFLNNGSLEFMAGEKTQAAAYQSINNLAELLNQGENMKAEIIRLHKQCFELKQKMDRVKAHRQWLYASVFDLKERGLVAQRANADNIINQISRDIEDGWE